MSAPEFRLFVDSHYMSPYVMSVYVALREKGVSFEEERIDLEAQENTRPEYRSTSLTGRVPTLEHGGLALSESSAITEYLEELFPPPVFPAIYPRNPVDRARARQVQAWLRSDLSFLREARPTHVIFRKPSEAPLSDKARLDAEKLFLAAESLLANHGASLFGEWCIADTDLALMLNRLVANGDPVPELLMSYVQQQWRRPSVREWMEKSKALADA